MKIYTIKNYGSRVKPKWSVDEHYGELGNFIAQVAFWWTLRANAVARGKEIAEEEGASFFNEFGKKEEEI